MNTTIRFAAWINQVEGRWYAASTILLLYLFKQMKTGLAARPGEKKSASEHDEFAQARLRRHPLSTEKRIGDMLPIPIDRGDCSKNDGERNSWIQAPSSHPMHEQ